MTITVDANKNKGVLLCDNSTTFEYIRHHFSVENKAKRFVKNPRLAKHLPSRLYAITPTGLFDAGMVDEITNFVAAEQLASQVKTTPLFDQLCNSIHGQIFNELALSLRDYQSSAVEKCLSNGRGICVLGTGAGKTLITAALACSLLHQKPSTSKILMLVPDPGLADQTFNDFKQYQVPFKMSLWSRLSQLDADAQIIVASHDILLSRIKDNAWVNEVDAIILDEVHTLKKDNKITKILDSIKTNNRFGFTGTLPVESLDLWCVLGKVGRVLMTVSGAQLRDQQVLANVKVNAINITYKSAPKYKHIDKHSENIRENYVMELDFIYDNDFRNSVITQVCRNYNKNVLVLINHLNHGDILLQRLSCLNEKRVVYIKGETSIDQRNEAKQLLESENNVVCIAMSSIFSTGINIKNLHMIIFAAGGKSFIRVVQSIGRGLRKTADKEMLTIIDIIDNLRYGNKHAMSRKGIYDIEKIKYYNTNLVEK